MKKNDIIILAVLIALLLGLRFIDDHVFKKIIPPQARPVAASGMHGTGTAFSAASTPEISAAPANVAAPAPIQAVAAADDGDRAAPEQTAELRNDRMKITVSSRGATITGATLFDYRRTIEKDSGPVVLDFATTPALSYSGLPGMSARHAFSLQADTTGRTVRLESKAINGLRVVRTIELGESHVISVQDDLINDSGAILKLAPYEMCVGSMRNDPGHREVSNFPTLGVDTLSPGGEGVKHWGSKIAGLFTQEQKDKNLPKLPLAIDYTPTEIVERTPAKIPVNWIATKNKYFAQILTPEDGADGFRIDARRTPAPREMEDPDFSPRMTPVEEIGATIMFPEQEIAPGETYTRKSKYYVGPKKYTELLASSQHHVEVMEFGIWGPIGKVLLKTLNLIHDHLWPHNYGIAIMLITIIIRVLFYPVTYKSTQSMKKMAALQPLMAELRKKYESNPQKMQQETMALYREHKVNPISGCLPMLIQIPVFIALFVVLRSAIELRFASFLWITDLSEPERLVQFGFALPLVGWDALNVLPLLMAATMVLQMKLTPSGGDPQQQKIMAFMMPVMMLFMLYNYAAGLALYWTTQNILMIIQQMIMRSHMPAAPTPVKT